MREKTTALKLGKLQSVWLNTEKSKSSAWWETIEKQPYTEESPPNPRLDSSLGSSWQLGRESKSEAVAWRADGKESALYPASSFPPQLTVKLIF